MSAFHKLISSVRSALEHLPETAEVPLRQVEPMPTVPSARRVELCARFARELEAVGGHFMGVLSPLDSARKVAELARQLGVHSASIGDGVEVAAQPFVAALRNAGLELVGVEEDGAMIKRLAACDLGVIEADYAVAASGTVAVIAGARRPNSLTLLPPINIILVHANRVMPDLAAVIAAFGNETIATRRISLITGPSRTADIEKMIVLGVHGPRELHVGIIWPER
ncbi:MAG: LutC/YkgG family protein [Candidatus Binataceae bacterium]